MATPSIAMIPAGYKTSKVYSQLPINGDGDLTFTRASSATRVNENGLIEEVVSNIPRLDYSDGGCPSLLLEPQSTNLLTYSEDFANVYYLKNLLGTGLAPVVTSNQAISPDGTMNADRVVFSNVGAATSGDLSIVEKNLGGGLSADLTISIWLKSNDSNNYDLYFGRTIGKDTIIEANQEWTRYEFSYNDATAVFGIGLRGTTGSSETADVLIWGAQLEQQSYATSYIPTTGATATRLADVASLTTTGFGLTSITETFKDGSTNVITTIPTTYNVSEGEIAKIIGE